MAAIELAGDLAVVDQDWCIGCGVCTLKCDFEAIATVYRDGQALVPADFETLHEKIQSEKG